MVVAAFACRSSVLSTPLLCGEVADFTSTGQQPSTSKGGDVSSANSEHEKVKKSPIGFLDSHGASDAHMVPRCCFKMRRNLASIASTAVATSVGNNSDRFLTQLPRLTAAFKSDSTGSASAEPCASGSEDRTPVASGSQGKRQRFQLSQIFALTHRRRITLMCLLSSRFFQDPGVED